MQLAYASPIDSVLSEIEVRVSAKLHDAYGSSYVEHDVSFEVPRSLKTVDCERYEIYSEPKNILGRSSWGLACANGEHVRTKVVTRTQVMLNLPRLMHSVNRGDLLTNEDWYFEVEPISRDAGYVLDISKRYISNRRLRAHIPIKQAQLVAASHVNEGDEVTVIVETGGVNVSTKAVAVTSSNIGQEISVKNTASGSVLVGILLSSNEVIVKP